jgi:hypothetical protein
MKEVANINDSRELELGRKEEEKMDQVIKGNIEGVTKKKGRKSKRVIEETVNFKEQNKFFIDVSKDHESRDLIINLLAQANNKTYGREIMLKDLLISVLPKITNKDIDKIQENSLDEMEKVERARDEYNKKNNSSLSLGEFLVMKLGINKEGRNV